MDAADNTSRIQSYRRTLNRRRHELITMATAVLFATAILGPLLSGPAVGPYQAFFFRLYLPFYAVGFGWYVWTVRPLSRHLPTSVALFAAFGGWVLVSLLWGLGPGFGVSWLFFITAGMFVGGAVFVTADAERTIWQYLLVVFALIAFGEIVAVWEIFTGGHLHPSRLAGPFGPDRVRFGVDMATAWFSNRNNLAFLFALAAGPLVALALYWDTRRVWRAFPLLAIALAVVVLISGGAWSALMSLAVTIVAIPIFSVSRSRLQSRSWTPPKHGALVLTVLAFLAAIAVIAITAFVPNPFGPPGSPFWQRWQLQISGLRIFTNTNGLGSGIGAFPAAMDGVPIETNETLAPHNWLFYVLGAFGIVGAVLFLAAFARLLYDLFVAYIDTGSTLQLGLLGTLLPLPLSAVGPSNSLHTYVFWLFLALAAAAAYRIDDPLTG